MRPPKSLAWPWPPSAAPGRCERGESLTPLRGPPPGGSRELDRRKRVVQSTARVPGDARSTPEPTIRLQGRRVSPALHVSDGIRRLELQRRGKE
jgi:hypothetical protein